MEKEKVNPFHKEYGLMSNILFVLDKMKRFDSYSLFLLVLGAVIAPFYQYLWTFMSKYIIDVITGDGDANRLIGVMIAFALAQVVITMSNSYVESEIWWRFIHVRMRVIMMINRKAMTIDF